MKKIISVCQVRIEQMTRHQRIHTEVVRYECAVYITTQVKILARIISTKIKITINWKIVKCHAMYARVEILGKVMTRSMMRACEILEEITGTACV